MRLVRVELARGVSVQGLSGVRSHLTSDDADLRMEDGMLVVRTESGQTSIPTSNILSLWAATAAKESSDDPKAALLDHVLSSSAEFLPSPSGKKTLRPGPKKK